MIIPFCMQVRYLSEQAFALLFMLYMSLFILVETCLNLQVFGCSSIWMEEHFSREAVRATV